MKIKILILVIFVAIFSTFNNRAQIVTDIDGNIYSTVTIGTQVWMVENLKVTHYRNGEDIINITNNEWWTQFKVAASCNYENNKAHSATHGLLYNWYAVNDSRNICPMGWHVPSEDEWTTLINYLGGKDVAADKMKKTGTTYWETPNIWASNESGFTALASGYRYGDTGEYSFLGKTAYFWTSTAFEETDAWFWGFTCYGKNMHHNHITKTTGHSVRCIKD